MEPATSQGSPSIFGFGEFVATLALLLVIYTVTDFKFRYRLFLGRVNLRKWGFFLSLLIGFSILLIDVWFHNGFLIPAFLNNEGNLKAFLGAIFFLNVFYVFFRSFIKPFTFGKRNAKNYFETIRYFVGEGNPERLKAVAEELAFSAKNIFVLASDLKTHDKNEIDSSPIYARIAHDLILILASRKLCKVIVESFPWVAAEIFTEASKVKNNNIPISQFANNIGREFIFNLDSALYHEDDGYRSGYFGYTKPVSSAIFADSDFVEHCATYNSPLDISFFEFIESSPDHLRGYAQASLLFAEDYFEKNPTLPTSFALNRNLDTFAHINGELYKLDGVEGEFRRSPEFERLRIVISFVTDLIGVMEENKFVSKGPLRLRDKYKGNTLDHIASLIFEIILSASSVKSPRETNWEIQRNSVWSGIFGFTDSDTAKILKFKVRRLLYNEIREMDEFPNFKGARILGFCLNVLGLKEEKPKRNYRKDEYPLRRVVLNWTQENYLKIREENPDVANAVLMGTITFDEKKNCLVKTYAKLLSKKAPQDFLRLKNP